MALYTGYYQDSKTDVSDILKRLSALEATTSSLSTKVSANTTKISTNKTDIFGNSSAILSANSGITSNKSEIDANYTFSQATNTRSINNGNKIATNVSHMENFESIFANVTYNTVQYPEPHKTGHPIGWLPLNHVDDTTTLTIDFHIWDMDTDLSSVSSLNVEYRLDASRQTGNASAYNFPINNLRSSSKKITHQIYNPRVSIDFKTTFPTIYQDLKVFRVVLILKTIGITGNEFRLFFHVKSL